MYSNPKWLSMRWVIQSQREVWCLCAESYRPSKDVWIRMQTVQGKSEEASVTCSLHWSCCHSSSHFPKVATQRLCNSTPPSLLRLFFSTTFWMCCTSFIRSSLCLLARSITAAWSHSVQWSCFQACSAMADFSHWPRLHESLGSFSLNPILRTVFPLLMWKSIHCSCGKNIHWKNHLVRGV